MPLLNWYRPKPTVPTFSRTKSTPIPNLWYTLKWIMGAVVFAAYVQLGKGCVCACAYCIFMQICACAQSRSISCRSGNIALLWVGLQKHSNPTPQNILKQKVIHQWFNILGPWLNRRRCVAVLMKSRASDVLTTTKVWLDGKDSVIFIFNFHFLLLWGFLQFVMIAPLSLMSKMSSSWLSVIIIKMKS